MTNLEHIMQDPELVKLCLAGKLAVKNGEPRNCTYIDGIDGISCKECDLNNRRNPDCNSARLEWLNAEYKPVPKLTDSEKCFVNLLKEDNKYIARNGSGGLYLFTDVPKRHIYSCGVFWDDDTQDALCISDFFNDMFNFITAEDEEPTSIEWLRTLEVEE